MDLDLIQKILVKAGRGDLAQEYYKKVSEKKNKEGIVVVDNVEFIKNRHGETWKYEKVGEKATVTDIEEDGNRSYYHLQPFGRTGLRGWTVPVGEGFLKKVK